MFKIMNKNIFLEVASVEVTPRTLLFEGKKPENQENVNTIRKGRLLLVNDQGFSLIPAKELFFQIFKKK